MRDPIVRRMRLRLDAHRAQPDDVPMVSQESRPNLTILNAVA